jgi:uncharacterized membrane protein
MKRITLLFPTWSRITFSTSFSLSFVTGILWFYLDRWGEIEGEFGPEKHPWLLTLAKIHGAGAFIALISIGMIISSHIPVGWRTGKNRTSGILIFASLTIMIVTAWGLYYIGTDEWRQLFAWLHVFAGCFLPVSIILHIRSGKRNHGKIHR